MQLSRQEPSPTDLTTGPLPAVRAALPAQRGERRGAPDRRNRVVWAMLYGSFNPRRRKPPRRIADSRFHSLDWHAPHLLGVAIGILLLSVADAFMTVTLLASGAVEVNPIMALIVYRSAAVFAAVKMAMTGIGVIVMVLLARYRLLRTVRVDVMMYAILLGYFALLSYEFRLTRELVVPTGF